MSDSRNELDKEAHKDDEVLFKRTVAALAVAFFGELAIGRRALFAYEAVRRAARWAANEKRIKGEVPSPEAAMEVALGDFFSRSRRALELAKPKLELIRTRTRARLSDPSIGAVVSGGAAVAVVATIGFVPAAIGATTAYLVHHYAHADDDENEAKPLSAPVPANSRA